jgi:D-alanine-D-alanine ligase
MRIGITFDLKDPSLTGRSDLPDDAQEEFDSPATIEAIATAIRGRGHEVLLLGDGRDFLHRVLADPPDLVFNFAEGQGVGRSREARVPAVLEMLGIPYTGSDPLTLAVTLDKDCAKRLAASYGVCVPPGVVIEPGQRADEALGGAALRFPVIVKPAWEGSSKGIRQRCVVERLPELAAVVESVRRDHRQPILVEEFIQGEELTVGVLGNDPPRAIGVLRVVPTQPTDHFVYGLEVKRDYRNRVRYESPPKLAIELLQRVQAAAVHAYRALGCRDVARLDFRVRDGVPYFLEVNPLPGLHPEDSDLVILARLQGLPYEQLIVAILDAALQRMSRARV